jgi:hypothetical protein
MKLRTFILFVNFIFSGLIVPLWDALSQGSSTASPTPISTLEPSKIDPLVRVRQMVENDPRNASDIVTKAIQADPQHSIFYAGEVVRSAIGGLGNSISEVAISFLVAAAVNAHPQAALQIVRVAVGETPPKLHATIVAAAVADVPDPYENVIVVHRRERSSEPPALVEKRNAFTVSKVFVTDGKSVMPDSKSVVAEGKAVATEGQLTVAMRLPAVGDPPLGIRVTDTSWMVPGMLIYMPGAGTFIVIGWPSDQYTAQIANSGDPTNKAPGTMISVGTIVGPASQRGATGPQGVSVQVLSYEPSTVPGSMTLAEAIIQAAIEGGSTAGLDALTNSVNFILLSTTPPLEGNPADPNSIAIPLPTPSPVSP